MTVRLDGTNGLDDGAGGPAPLVGQAAAKAWANITTTTTTTNNDSLNISSLTDEGTGQTTYNFTSNFSAATYSMIGCSGNNGLIANFPQTSYSAAVGSIRGLTGTDPSTASDAPIISSEFTGDLA